MAERHAIQAAYRGAVYSGEWFVEGGVVHLVSALGRKQAPFVGGRSFSVPSDVAARLLRELAREHDPKRRFFDFL